MKLKQIYIHIGQHRTGSKSLQKLLSFNRARLSSEGIDFFRGRIEDGNHIELFLACIRPERESFSTLKYQNMLGPTFFDETAKSVHRFIESSKARSVIFSTEGLSLLRFSDETRRLRSLMGSLDSDIFIILILRNPTSFLQSYKNQLLKDARRRPSLNKNSALYVEPDTWLINYESLLRVYEAEFGQNFLRVIDYDLEMKRNGDVLPAVLKSLDIDSRVNIELGQEHMNRSLSPFWRRAQALRVRISSAFDWQR